METAELPILPKERYTYEDYAQLPEGAPYELIRGELVISPSPSTEHQCILRTLFRAIDRFVEEQREGGEVLFAPMDVYLSAEDTLQPDLIYITGDRRNIVGTQKIDGAPDLTTEVLSPSTACRDLMTTKRLYEQHGVKEYWIVDPEGRTVEVFENTGGRFMQHTRAVESGTATSTLLGEFEVDLADLFRQ